MTKIGHFILKLLRYLYAFLLETLNSKRDDTAIPGLMIIEALDIWLVLRIIRQQLLCLA